MVRKDHWKVTKVRSKWSLTLWRSLAECIIDLLKYLLKGSINRWKNGCFEHSFVRWLNRMLQRCWQSWANGFRKWLKVGEIWTRGGEDREWTKEKKDIDWHTGIGIRIWLLVTPSYSIFWTPWRSTGWMDLRLLSTAAPTWCCTVCCTICCSAGMRRMERS